MGFEMNLEKNSVGAIDGTRQRVEGRLAEASDVGAVTEPKAEKGADAETDAAAVKAIIENRQKTADELRREAEDRITRAKDVAPKF